MAQLIQVLTAKHWNFSEILKNWVSEVLLFQLRICGVKMAKQDKKPSDKEDRKPAKKRSDPLSGIKPDREQRAVITSPAEVIQVSAYAGTGKTTTLALRQRRLIEDGARTKDFLAITLTKTGAKELGKKLNHGTNVRTIHSLAYELVKTRQGRAPSILGFEEELSLIGHAAGIEAEKLRSGSSRRRTLLDIQQQSKGQRNARALLEIMAIKGVSLYALVNGSDRRWAAYKPYLSALKLLAPRVQKLKTRRGVYTFADLIGPAISAAKVDAKLPWKHLMVDEFQDCTPAQVALIEALVPHMKSTVVVGDRNQEIYGFAGAKFTDLVETFPLRVELPLTKSRRLTDQNAALATALIRQVSRKMPPVVGARGRGRRPHLREKLAAEEHAEAVAELIGKLVARGVAPGEIAVLGRTKSMLRPVERELRGSGVESDARFRKGKELIHLSLGLLGALDGLVVNQGSEEKTRKYLNTHAFTTQLRVLLNEKIPAVKGVKQTTQHTNARLIKMALEPGVTIQARLILCNKVVISQQGGSGKSRGNESLDADTVDRLTRWEPLCNDPKIKTVSQLKRRINRQRKSERVVLSTVHAAKGSEWPYVIVLNVVDGCLPLQVGNLMPDLEYERNVLYVACTRAIKRLYLMEAPLKKLADRSPFLTDSKTLKALRLSS